MYYIHAIQSMNNSDVFKQEDIHQKLVEVSENPTLVTPDFKTYIAPTALRRLSPILRMGITLAKEVQAAVDQPFDAISVGTGLGCLTDTEKFLNVIYTVEGDVLSPTAFIQSTHNTIAGQISLDLGNHSYNMTHTQNNLSFEMALIDGMLCCEEGSKNVLVGAADESIEFLNKLKPTVFDSDTLFTTSATFLAISTDKKESSIAILACKTIANAAEISVETNAFLAAFGLSLEQINCFVLNTNELETPANSEVFHIDDQLGFNQSSSAFAVHVAHDFLKSSTNEFALIVNRSSNNYLGLILLKNDKTHN